MKRLRTAPVGFGHKCLASLALLGLASFADAQISPVLLPSAPPGFSVREVARFNGPIVRLASDGEKGLYAISTAGDVWRVDAGSGQKVQVLKAADYAGPNTTIIGLAIDGQHRIYIVSNLPEGSAGLDINHVTIFRAVIPAGGVLAVPVPWFETTYPYGVDTFNHGVNKIQIGPDGYLYVSSGSRTDHGEARHQAGRSTEGEVPLTGCIWKLDPNATHPEVEIWADGIRNAFGFCWDSRGRLWATENGPNADAPEELNRLGHGKHYGFPYQFSDLPGKLYPDQPATPEGLKIELPVINDGPDGGKGISTFDPHSSPSGIVWINNWGPDYSNGFLMGRFGNLIGPRNVGFDLLWVKPSAEDSGGKIHAEVRQFMPAVGRITDVIKVDGKVYVCLYSSQTQNAGPDQLGTIPRILEIRKNP